MTLSELNRKLAAWEAERPDGPVAPPLPLIAFCVIVGRRMMGWKQETLASMAGVALSTVERVERGESVSRETLEKIGALLGHPPGAFTEPRIGIGLDEAARQFADQWRTRMVVAVAPFENQRQIRSAIAAHYYLLHRVDIPADADAEIRTLIEWLDLGASMYSGFPFGEEPMPKREFYREVLKGIHALRARGIQVLVGNFDVSRAIGNMNVCLVSLTLAKDDPAAAKRKVVIVDTRPFADHTTAWIGPSARPATN